MRITRNIMFSRFLAALDRLDGRIGTSHRQISSGRRVEKLSDDPAAASRIRTLTGDLSDLGRLDRSSQAGRSIAALVEGTLSEIGNGLIRARELAVRGANLDAADAREDIAVEVEALRDQILAASAVQKDGRYVTSGTQTDVPPFDTAGNYQGNASALTAEVADGERIVVAPTAAEFLQGSIDVPAALTQLAADLRANDSDGVRAAIPALETALEQLNVARGRLGATINRIDAAISQRAHVRETILAEVNQLGDANLAAIVVDLARDDQARQATLAAGGRIGGPTLFDFLR